ncbi:MAG: hypothetical protein GX083_05195 [Clostridiales bacterium]|nr:hypothetical protein [Clostridiales bacterium]
MKYVFIINPASGGGRHEKRLVPDIEQLAADNPDIECKIYYTSGGRDATVLADYTARETDDEVFIFACGGDGTVQEVANGIVGHDNAILGVIPVGRGNDLVRQLGGGKKEGENFRNLYAQLNGKVNSMDLIKMSWTEGDKEKSCYVVNGINIGFDGNTALATNELARNPYVTGHGAYLIAAAKTFIGKEGENLRITADGKEFYNGKLLLATIGNGGFCGGGVYSCPRADLYDGLLELMAIKDVTRRKFVSLFFKYKNGKILDIDNRDEILEYEQAKNIVIEPLAASTMKFVADGEGFETGVLKIEVAPRAIRVLNI